MMFSVIVPVYNAAKYLRPCLDSVLNQTERDWECVCVDDGSKDESGKILDEYAAKDPRFKVIHQTNGGEGVARNAGLAAAVGEWITWIDADDFYALDRLSEARRLIELEGPDLVRFRTYFGKADETGLGGSKIGNKTYRVFAGTNAKKWGWHVLAPGGMVWTWVAKRELLEGMSFVPGMRVKVDSIFSGSLANRLDKVVQSEYQAYFYRQLETSAIHSVRRADDCMRLLREVKNLYLSQLPSREIIGESVFGAMVRWLRVHSEEDIIDWMVENPFNRTERKKLYALYRELLDDGTFDCAMIIRKRYRWAVWLWGKSGQSWAISLVGWVEKFVRKMKR